MVIAKSTVLFENFNNFVFFLQHLDALVCIVIEAQYKKEKVEEEEDAGSSELSNQLDTLFVSTLNSIRHCFCVSITSQIASILCGIENWFIFGLPRTSSKTFFTYTSGVHLESATPPWSRTSFQRRFFRSIRRNTLKKQMPSHVEKSDWLEMIRSWTK